MRTSEIQKNKYLELFLVAFLTFSLCSLYLPWKWTSFMLVPLYLFALWQRDNIQVEKNIKYVFVSFVGYMLFFSLFSQEPRHSFKGMYDVLRGLLLFPVAIAFSQLAARRASWTMVNFVVLLLVLGSLFFPQEKATFYSYFVNPNNAAVLLIVLICLLIPMFGNWMPAYPYWISGAGMLVALPLLIFTNGRGAWLGLTAAVICYALFRTGIRKRYKTAAVSLIGGAFLVAFLYFNQKGTQLSSREGLWVGLFNETLDKHLLFGYGFNAVKDLIDHLGLITRTAHNIFLEIFVSSGLVGLMFILLLVFYLWKVLTRYSYPNSPHFVSGFLCVIAFIVMGQFDLKFSSFRFIGTISFFLGMIYSQRLEKKAYEVESQNA